MFPRGTPGGGTRNHSVPLSCPQSQRPTGIYMLTTCLQHALCPQVVVLPAYRICRLLWSSVLWGQEGCDGGRSRPGGGGELGDCRLQEQGTPTQWPHSTGSLLLTPPVLGGGGPCFMSLSFQDLHGEHPLNVVGATVETRRAWLVLFWLLKLLPSGIVSRHLSHFIGQSTWHCQS